MHNQNYEVIAALNACSAECNHCFNACLAEQDVKMMAHCIQLDRYCSEICSITAAWLASGSEFGPALRKLCADICDTCAAECEKHEDAHCRRCAEACRKCSAECRKQ